MSRLAQLDVLLLASQGPNQGISELGSMEALGRSCLQALSYCWQDSLLAAVGVRPSLLPVNWGPPCLVLRSLSSPDTEPLHGKARKGTPRSPLIRNQTSLYHLSEILLCLQLETIPARSFFLRAHVIRLDPPGSNLIGPTRY